MWEFEHTICPWRHVQKNIEKGLTGKIGVLIQNSLKLLLLTQLTHLTALRQEMREGKKVDLLKPELAFSPQSELKLKIIKNKKNNNNTLSPESRERKQRQKRQEVHQNLERRPKTEPASTKPLQPTQLNPIQSLNCLLSSLPFFSRAASAANRSQIQFHLSIKKN